MTPIHAFLFGFTYRNGMVPEVFSSKLHIGAYSAQKMMRHSYITNQFSKSTTVKQNIIIKENKYGERGRE